MKTTPVRFVLFGRPLSERTPDFMEEDCRLVNSLLDKLIDMLLAEHSDASRVPRTSRAILQAEREMRVVQGYPASSPSASFGRRALVLYGMWQEPDFAEWLATERSVDDEDAEIVRDLTERVLPVAGPVYLRGLGQRPDAFVALCATMLYLWTDCAFELYGEDGDAKKVQV
jgi:hypothetical protein